MPDPPVLGGSPRLEASAIGWGVSAPLPPCNSGPLPLSSPINVSSFHVAQAAGLRAAQQEHVGLEEQRRGQSTWLSPSSPKLLPPHCPWCAASSGAPLTGTKLSLRKRTMSPTQMSRHFCQWKLQEN